jgi:hypothetical protein
LEKKYVCAVYRPPADGVEKQTIQALCRPKAQYLIPNQVRELTNEIIRNIHDKLTVDIDADFDAFYVFTREISMWKCENGNDTHVTRGGNFKSIK